MSEFDGFAPGLPRLQYTQVPDEVFDTLLQDLGYAELKVLLVIIRQTFGWKKTEDDISLSQIEQMSGLNQKSVLSGLRLLLERGLIILEFICSDYDNQTCAELVGLLHVGADSPDVRGQVVLHVEPGSPKPYGDRVR